MVGHDDELKYKPEEIAHDVVIPSPMMMAAYNTGDMAFYITTGILAGGVIALEGNHPILLENTQYVLDSINAVVEEQTGAQNFYEDVDFDNSELAAGTYYGVLILGGSYKPADWISLSLSGKMIYAWGKIGLKTDFQVKHVDFGWGDAADGTDMIEVQADQTGFGFSGQASVHMRPLDGLDIAFKYETLTKINMTDPIHRFRRHYHGRTHPQRYSRSIHHWRQLFHSSRSLACNCLLLVFQLSSPWRASRL